MLLTYENSSKGISVECKEPVHVPPHLHEAIEMIYVTEGVVELGVGTELYHMEKGDFAIVFPNVIHHYQVFGKDKNKAIYMFVEHSLVPSYTDELQKYSPKYPIIREKDVPQDVINAITTLSSLRESNNLLAQAYVQIILAYVFCKMEMIEKETIGGKDIIYKAVEYVAKNYREEMCLDKMAFDLGVSKYVLSRMFAKTFHCNFNKYVNGVRLNYALTILENSNESITNLCFDCGFESQRTFNRVFKERFKMTPREYRNKVHTIKMEHGA